MFKQSARYFLLVVIFGAFYPFKLLAQVVPDNTLGSESSTIRSVDDLRSAIEGGAIRGNNLFHSFQEFNVGEGSEIDFANPVGIENIYSRVTGNNISEIFGTLGVNGSANLFLLNPNGIIFGKNAAIDINGSFMATTAESINFDNGDRFSSINPDAPSITIDLPIGLGFGSNPGDINIQGQQNNVSLEIPSFRVTAEDLPPAIEVNPGENISLIGGNISFNGGGLQAPSGNIELQSIDSNQILKLLPSDNWFVADSSSTSNFRDIGLNNAAYVDVSDRKAGNISISGRQIVVDDGSAILANTFLPTKNTINIHASELLEIKGTSGEFEADFSFADLDNLNSSSKDKIKNNYSVSLVGADIFSGSNGTGNSINIEANSLRVLDAGQIRTVNFSQGKSSAGNINIEAESILVEGTNNIDSIITSVINSSTGSGSIGNGGNVNIFTQTLEIKDGGRIKSDSFGIGSGGNLTVKSEDILLQGFAKPFVPILTGLYASSPIDDDTGNIDISTETLNILNGAVINASTFGKSSAGNIDINSKSINVSGSVPFGRFFPSSIISSVILRRTSGIANEVFEADPQAGSINISTVDLKVFDGARIEATNSVGNSGNITINAQSIELNGTRPKISNFIGGISTSTLPSSSGNGGDISITTDSLKILNGSIIRAISLGGGDAGNIKIHAQNIKISGFDRFASIPVDDRRVSKINTGALSSNGGNLSINSGSISVDNLGLIQATTEEGSRGGNITLNTDNLSLRGESGITTSAGGSGNGGNIIVDSDSIIGFENSDITANAVGGTGGNIDIDSNYIIGLEGRPELTPMSDITASSELGIDGTVSISTLFSNLQRDLELSELNLITDEDSLANSCLTRHNSQQGSFVVNNGGSLSTMVESDFQDSGSITGMDNSFSPDEAEQLPIKPKPTKNENLIPAQQVVKTGDGRIFLVSAPQSVKSLICN